MGLGPWRWSPQPASPKLNEEDRLRQLKRCTPHTSFEMLHREAKMVSKELRLQERDLESDQ